MVDAKIVLLETKRERGRADMEAVVEVLRPELCGECAKL